RLVHGQSGLDAALRATDVLFGGSMAGLQATDLVDIFADVPSTELAPDKVADRPAIEVAVAAGLCASKGEARRLATGGGLYINNERASSADVVVQRNQIIDGRILVMRSGRKSFHLVKIV
ncbi:MAG: S4 domain-containing protein, partial [bacterium]